MKIPQNSLARGLQSQLFFWTGETPETIIEQLEILESILENGKDLSLCELAYKIYLENSQKSHNSNKNFVLAIVAESFEELRNKVKTAQDLLKEKQEFIPARRSPQGVGGRDSKGIYFSSNNRMAKKGKIAFLFPGQGSQRPNMLKDLTEVFPQMRESTSKADLVLKKRLPKLLSEYIFPHPPVTPEEEKAQMEELIRTNIAQPALGAVEVGLLKVMKLFGVNADMMAGHSLGEYVALYAAGVFEEETLYELLEYRGSAIINSNKGGDLGTMLAVGGSAEDIEDIIKSLSDVYIANLNSPTQTILSGSDEALDLASVKLNEKGFRSKKINVSCAFHSPYMMPARDFLLKKLSSLDYKTPLIPVYSNLSAKQYPKDKKSILSILSDHLTSPVKFKDEVENMFKDGAKMFLEIGPGNVLTNLVKQILIDKEYLAIPSNIKTTPDISQILNVLAQLIAEVFNVNLSVLFDNRESKAQKVYGV